ncbi:MAG: hypothetical protein RLY78_2939 [Pseudomonadota bacterium]|jgi:3-oxoacyl-[acyl-carrier protein] reductase
MTDLAHPVNAHAPATGPRPAFPDLRGQRVLITGATEGIGWAAVQAFAAQGARVVFNGRRTPEDLAPRLQALRADGGDAHFIAADIRHTAETERLVAEAVAWAGGLDTLVHNAGGLVARRPLAQIDDAFFDAVTDLNARSALHATRCALPHLSASARARGCSSAVILVGSVAGHTGGGPGAGLYGAAKAWLHNLVKHCVAFHTADGVRFNLVSPGTFDTAFHADKDAAARQRVSAGIPLGRFGQPAECAPAFLFLASPAASGYITGQCIEVNGGQFMP